MMDDSEFLASLEGTELAAWCTEMPALIERAMQHGELHGWKAIIDQLPRIAEPVIDLTGDCVQVGLPEQMEDAERGRLAALLAQFHPWRKGPFSLFGIHLDTEWRSDWKWRRLAGHIAPLDGRRVLDVGCGNGYYGWRMLGAGAARVIGVDPTLRYVMQYRAVARLMGPSPNHVLPLGLEQLPMPAEAFDTVFSMGVIYHRRAPAEHLERLKSWLREEGELVLEGLVIEGGAEDVLHPEGRYAKMKNVFAIPSADMMVRWLEQAGFRDVRHVDSTITTSAEQRRTPWMHFESLRDFLDPADPTRTVEGHPAPMRGLFVARK